MKIFLDTLDTSTISEFYEMGILAGVTTNPTLAKRFGMSDDIDMINKIREVMPVGEIHVEAFGKTKQEILGNAERIIKMSKDDNLVFKVPFSEEGVSAVKELVDKKQKTNLHLIFSKAQAALASCVGSTYICPLVGRLDDIGHDALDNLHPVVNSFRKSGSKTKVMVSSVRHVQHVVKAFELTADAVTIPESVLRSMFNHPLTSIGYDKFHSDIRSMESVTLEDIDENLIVEEDASLKECLKTLTENKASCLAVTKNNLLTGVFTLGDLKRALSLDGQVDLKTPVSNYMNPSPIAISIDETHSDANSLMIENDISDLVVVDQNKVVGVLSSKKA